MTNPQLALPVHLRRRRSRFTLTRRFLALVLILLVVILLSANYLTNFRAWEPARITWFVTGAGSLILIAVFRKVEGLDWLSSPVAYALIFWLFHFGLVFPASIVPSILDQFDPWDIEWTRYPEGAKATLLSMLFLAAFCLGWLLIHRTRHDPSSGARSESVVPELVAMGRLIVLGALVMATIGVARFGIDSFLRSYEQFFEIHNTFSSAVVVVAFGFILQLAGGRPVRLVLHNMVWGYLPLAVMTFLAGARTSPMVTAVVLGIVITYRGVRVPRLGLWIAAVLVLLSISVVRETRRYGLIETLSGRITTSVSNPLGGMTELGGSLRPVAATIHFIEVANNEWFYGQTYVYPIWRVVQRVAGLPRSDPEADPRFIATYISRLYYSAMGYSVVAEGFVNAGAPGVVLFASAWGALLALLERYADRAYGLALLGAVMISMLTNVRNSFIFVPAWTFLAIAALLFAHYMLRPLMNRRSKRVLRTRTIRTMTNTTHRPNQS